MDEKMMDDIRKNERYYRLKAGITAKQIGEATGHTTPWITQFETGIIQGIRDKDLRKVAKILGVKLSDLVKPAEGMVVNVTTAEHDFGLENLEKIRKHRKLTDHEFSDFLGLSYDHYHKVMAGYSHFGIRAWWRIAEALRMDMKILIGRGQNEAE